MSNLEKICICADDDLTTSVIFKFCIADNEDEFQYINKYQSRVFISVIVDCLMFPLLMLAADKFQVENLGIKLGLIMQAVAFVVHLVCYCKLQRLKVTDPGTQSTLMCVSKVLLALECCYIFLCSLTRCMLTEIQDYVIQDQTCIQAEVQFRSLNFYAGSLAYGGYCIGLFWIKQTDSDGTLRLNTLFYVIVIWMILDLTRLSWFCLKSIKKQNALFQFEQDPKYVKPSMKGNKYTYQQQPPQSVEALQIEP